MIISSYWHSTIWSVAHSWCSSPPQKRPGRWGDAQSPVHPRFQSVTWSPQDDGCMSLVHRRCSPGALCPIGVRHGGRCCTSSLQPLEKKRGMVKRVAKELNRELLIKQMQINSKKIQMACADFWQVGHRLIKGWLVWFIMCLSLKRLCAKWARKGAKLKPDGNQLHKNCYLLALSKNILTLPLPWFKPKKGCIGFYWRSSHWIVWWDNFGVTPGMTNQILSGG